MGKEREPVVIITGGSAGIGRATAELLAAQGSRLILAARQPELLRQAALAIERQYNAEVMSVVTDTTQADQCQALVQKALDRFGHIDVLINNAGICLSGAFLDTTPEQWQQVFNTNLWGYVQMIQAVLPSMQARHKGQIINVGSIGGKIPLPLMSAYCASKYAVTGLTAALRLELQSQGIEVMVVHPGIVRSDFMERALWSGDPSQQAQLRQRLEAAQTQWLASDPDTIATAIVQAAEHNTGDIVVGWAAAIEKAYTLFPEGVGSLLNL